MGMHSYDDTFIDLVLQMLKYNPSERPHAVDMFIQVADDYRELLVFGCQTKTIAKIEKVAYFEKIYDACNSGDQTRRK
jgi:hypothetical protein